MEFKTVEEVLQSYSKINEASLLRLKIVIYQTEGRKKKKGNIFFSFLKKIIVFTALLLWNVSGMLQ